MPSLPSFRRPLRNTVVVLLAALGTGCVRPLAIQHEFFSPTGGVADGIRMQTQHTIIHYRALQDACRSTGALAASRGVTGIPDGPDAVLAATGEEALAGLCVSSRKPPAAYGGTSDAYRRWVEDRVRTLPDASETAASAAGGS